MVIPQPTLSAWENWIASCFITGHLVAALRRRTEFNTVDNYMLLLEGQGDIRSHHVQGAQTALDEAMAEALTLDSCWMRQGTKTED